MASQNYVDGLNSKISYPEGKIYWKPNKYWTSKLMEKLQKQGWMIDEHKSGLTDIYDKEGNKVVWGAIGRPNALYELAKVFI